MHRLATFRFLRPALLIQPRAAPPLLYRPSSLAQIFFSSSTSASDASSHAPADSSAASSAPSSTPLSFIERAKRDGAASLIGPFRSSGGFDSLLHNMTVERMDSTGHTSCLLPLSSPALPSLSFHNSHGRLHGGVHALLVDVVGTLALLARDSSKGGVSVDIQCQYMESVEVTDTLRCVGRVLKLGKRLGFAEVKLYRESDGKLVASGKHIKAM